MAPVDRVLPCRPWYLYVYSRITVIATMRERESVCVCIKQMRQCAHWVWCRWLFLLLQLDVWWFVCWLLACDNKGGNNNHVHKRNVRLVSSGFLSSCIVVDAQCHLCLSVYLSVWRWREAWPERAMDRRPRVRNLEWWDRQKDRILKKTIAHNEEGPTNYPQRLQTTC